MSIFFDDSESATDHLSGFSPIQTAERITTARLSLSGAKALILHEESFVRYGLTALLRKQNCQAEMMDLDRAEAGIGPETDDPDVCFCGNLDDCGPTLLNRVHMRFPKTRLVLFDVDMMDDVDVTAHATSCQELGFDDFLPAYSSEERLINGISGVFSRAAHRTTPCETPAHGPGPRAI